MSVCVCEGGCWVVVWVVMVLAVMMMYVVKLVWVGMEGFLV